MLPISVDIDTTKTWALQASKTGYSDYSQPITFDDGQAEKSYTVVARPEGHRRRGVAAATGLQRRPPAPRSAPPAPAPAAARRRRPRRQRSSEAFLNINSIPPSTCFLDGRSLGQHAQGARHGQAGRAHGEVRELRPGADEDHLGHRRRRRDQARRGSPEVSQSRTARRRP